MYTLCRYNINIIFLLFTKILYKGVDVMYSQSGVYIDEATLFEGKKAKLRYNGYLFNNGAKEIYVHLGFGLLWENLNEVKMIKKVEGFEAEVPLVKADSLNFCFRDDLNNWDNNSFQNYSYDVKRMSKVENPTQSKINNVVKIDSIEIKNTMKKRKTKSMIDKLDLTKNSTSSIEVSRSLVPIINGDFGQYRNLPEHYLRNKKMRILFYRMFAYVPRLLNGYNKKRARTLLGK